jgi:hypothetical protein
MDFEPVTYERSQRLYDATRTRLKFYAAMYLWKVWNFCEGNSFWQFKNEVVEARKFDDDVANNWATAPKHNKLWTDILNLQILHEQSVHVKNFKHCDGTELWCYIKHIFVGICSSGKNSIQLLSLCGLLLDRAPCIGLYPVTVQSTAAELATESKLTAQPIQSTQIFIRHTALKCKIMSQHMTTCH